MYIYNLESNKLIVIVSNYFIYINSVWDSGKMRKLSVKTLFKVNGNTYNRNICGFLCPYLAEQECYV